MKNTPDIAVYCRRWHSCGLVATAAVVAILSLASAAGEAEKVATRLLPSPFKENMLRERRFLVSLEPLALTREFRRNAGFAPLPEDDGILPLGGWEKPGMELRGHTCGHWLSGMASLYEATGDESLRRRAAETVGILRQCQDAMGSGYLSAFPESGIDKTIRGERYWAPWYTLHKILAGLLDQHECCGNPEALEVAARFGDWAAEKVLPLTSEEAANMRKCEFGGIAESLLLLSAAVDDPVRAEKYRRAASVFHDPTVMDPLDRREDRLHGRHANTFIPKVIADMRKWELLGDKAAFDRAHFFWRTVMDGYLYAPGCVSSKEAFRGPGLQGRFVTGMTGETCCTVNLLKLSRRLFAASDDDRERAELADYQERALWNHILGQMNPIDGALTYFLPLETGTYKLQSRPNDCFWCCMGTAMESHTRIHRVVAEDVAGTLYVNHFIPAEIRWRGMTLRLETRFPEEESATLRVIDAPDSRQEAEIAIRLPFWTKDGCGRSSYARHSRIWKRGDALEIPLPCRLRTESIPAAPSRKAVFFGPILLAGRLGVEGIAKNRLRSTNYATHDFAIPPHLASVPLEPLDSWRRIAPPPPPPRDMDGATVETLDFFAHPSFVTPSGLKVSPFWAVHDERHVVYFDEPAAAPAP